MLIHQDSQDMHQDFKLDKTMLKVKETLPPTKMIPPLKLHFQTAMDPMVSRVLTAKNQRRESTAKTTSNQISQLVLRTLAMFCHFALKPQEESQMKPAGRELVLCNSDKTEEKLVLNQETPPLMRTILLKKPNSQPALVLKVKRKVLTAKK